MTNPQNHPDPTSYASGYPPSVPAKAHPAQKAAAKNAWQQYVDDAERTQRAQRELVRASLLKDLHSDHRKAA